MVNRPTCLQCWLFWTNVLPDFTLVKERPHYGVNVKASLPVERGWFIGVDMGILAWTDSISYLKLGNWHPDSILSHRRRGCCFGKLWENQMFDFHKMTPRSLWKPLAFLGVAPCHCYKFHLSFPVSKGQAVGWAAHNRECFQNVVEKCLKFKELSRRQTQRDSGESHLRAKGAVSRAGLLSHRARLQHDF